MFRLHFFFLFSIADCFSCFFAEKEYDNAIELYTKAIELMPTSAVYYANRSLAHLRLESFGSALEDGVSAVKSDPSYLKGYYRRAAAQMSLGKFKKALADFEFVAKLRPNDKNAQLKFTECNKLVKKQAFEKAISNDVPEKTLAEVHSDLESIGMYAQNLIIHWNFGIYQSNFRSNRRRLRWATARRWQSHARVHGGTHGIL